jgi:nucleotide-binding universal stress UspA family protein
MARAHAGGAPRKILLATDLTPACDRAFDRAAQLAAAWNAELIACHVVEASSLRSWGIERRVHNAETEMERLVRGVRLRKKLAHHIVIGDPAERTLKYAEQVGADFLVTGPAHGKIIGDKLLGSTAARILRQAQQPVLAVRRRPEAPYTTVAVAVDFSAPSRRAFRCGQLLFPQARFTLVHAYEVSPDFGGRNEDKSLDVLEAEEKARIARVATQDFADLIASGRAGSKAETVLEQGTPQAVLTSYVERNWPDLVVAGTRGQSGSQETLMGSVAEGLLKSLPCDVLAVPVER